MEKKTKFKRRMFAVAAIVGMGMTMTQIAFGKKGFNAENGGLNYVLPADNGYYFLCSGHIYFLGMVMLQNRLYHCAVVLIAVIQQRIVQL